MDSNPVNKWNEFYREAAKRGGVATWPSENLVRCFKARYFSWFKESYERNKVIDVGFGSGSNLMFCGSLGMEIYGVEIHGDICRQSTETLKELGYEADLRIGDNRHIPFPDNYFDYLISWDVIHYEGEEGYIAEAIAEYHRVLKPTGRFFLSTVAPDHSILENSKALGAHRYEINWGNDFRNGQVFFYFDSPKYIQFYFSKHFADVVVGRSCSDYFGRIRYDAFLVTGLKV